MTSPPRPHRSLFRERLLFAPPPLPLFRPPRAHATHPPALTRRALLRLLPLLPVPALSAQYDAYAPTYDALDGSNALTRLLGFDRLRADLLRHADGHVLEVGIGTGLNLPLYRAASSITGLDQSAAMLSLASRRAQQLGLYVNLVHAPVEHNPLRDGAFDTVVDTFSLCVYADPLAALREMRRVVRPGGRVLLLEHAASDNDLLAAYQDATAAATAALSKGCVPNQRVAALAQQAGFRVQKEQRSVGGTVVSLQLVY